MHIFVTIKADVVFRGRHKLVTVDRLPLELVEAETIAELRKRGQLLFDEWSQANRQNFSHAWHMLTGVI